MNLDDSLEESFEIIISILEGEKMNKKTIFFMSMLICANVLATDVSNSSDGAQAANAAVNRATGSRRTHEKDGYLFLNGVPYEIGKMILANCLPHCDGSENFGNDIEDALWIPSIEYKGLLFRIHSKYDEPLSIVPYPHYCHFAHCVLIGCPNH